MIYIVRTAYVYYVRSLIPSKSVWRGGSDFHLELIGLVRRLLTCHDCDRCILRPCQPAFICADLDLILHQSNNPDIGIVHRTCKAWSEGPPILSSSSSVELFVDGDGTCVFNDGALIIVGGRR